MTLKVDLTGVEAWSGGIIQPPFDGLVEVEDAEEGTSSGGNPQFMLELRALEGEQQGSSIRDWIVVTPQSAGRVKQVLEAMGVSNLDGEVAFDAPEMVGKRCRITVRSELYNGQDRARVKAYQPEGAATNGAAPTAGAADSEKLAF